jgi:hypothetical protein
MENLKDCNNPMGLLALAARYFHINIPAIDSEEQYNRWVSKLIEIYGELIVAAQHSLEDRNRNIFVYRRHESKYFSVGFSCYEDFCKEVHLGDHLRLCVEELLPLSTKGVIACFVDDFCNTTAYLLIRESYLDRH